MEKELRKKLLNIIFVPMGCTANKLQSDVVTENIKCEYHWPNKAKELSLEKEKLEETEYLLWLAHFASLQTAVLSPTAIKSNNSGWDSV